MLDTFCLNNSTSKGNGALQQLLKELRGARNQPVYSTYVSDVSGNMLAVICTTNEKVHLGFGKLSKHALRTLVKLFEERTRLDDQMVFTFEHEEGQVNPRNLFVTASENDSHVRIFHVAPGH